MPSSGPAKLAQQQRRRDLAKLQQPATKACWNAEELTSSQRNALMDELKADRADHEEHAHIGRHRRPLLKFGPADHVDCDVYCRCFGEQQGELRQLRFFRCPTLARRRDACWPCRYYPEGAASANGGWELTRELDKLAEELVFASGPQLTVSWSTIKQVVLLAWRLVESMRWIRDDDGFILAWRAHCELQYPAAALALRCGLFVDAQGELQPRAAAMAFGAALTGEPKLSGGAADCVQAWLSKLQRLEQACLDEYVERMQAQAQFEVSL